LVEINQVFLEKSFKEKVDGRRTLLNPISSAGLRYRYNIYSLCQLCFHETHFQNGFHK